MHSTWLQPDLSNAQAEGCTCLQNPWEGSSRTVSLPQRTPYPSAYQKLFRGPNAPEGGYLFIPPRDPTMLDYQDFSFVLIGRSPAWRTSLIPE